MTKARRGKLIPHAIILAFAFFLLPVPAIAREPIPDKLVVLTFDDSVKSQYAVVRPILKKHGFGATFFVTEGFDFPTNKTDYMTWEEIAQLHADGFEIGNHTRDHFGVKKENVDKLADQVRAIADRCRERNIPPPVTFAWAGNGFDLAALPVLKGQGILFARRGGAPEYPYANGRGFAYEPGLDHPLLVPSAGDARPNWTLVDFISAVEQAKRGRIAVLQFHGVPDKAHPWVNTTPENFEVFMSFLARNHYRVISMRDLTKFVDPNIMPSDPAGVIEDRKKLIASSRTPDDFRRSNNEDELRDWLENMAVFHRFTLEEIGAATGLTTEEAKAALSRLGLDRKDPPKRQTADRLFVLPYPGGRHPRISFLDGAIRPRRETKISVFTPWDDGSYVVIDVPEAIWSAQAGRRELLYLAHTHVPTKWDAQRIELERLEWRRQALGVLSVARRLPDGVTFGATITPDTNALRMDLWITNGTKQTLTGLAVQNCAMLKGVAGFNQLTNDNKVFRKPFVACRNPEGNRWIITAWEPCVRPWANASCPCMHSDPQFPDCAPGETQHVSGWLSFYEGQDVEAEFRRIQVMEWPKR